MFYIIQENVFQEENYNKIFIALEKLGLEYEIASLNNGELFVNTNRKDIFTFGSIRMARLATKKGWYPGSYFGNNHDYEVYSKYYGDNLLNYDCKIINVTEELEWRLNEVKFIRPTKDSKLFSGKLFTNIKWVDTLELIKNKFTGDLNSIMIQVNAPKIIYKEARCWIVGNKVVSSSYYKFASNVSYIELVDPEGLEFANKMLNIYKVADAFVMDICLTPDGWKIVEINCINCSGFYKGDLQKILMSLEYFYEE